MAAPASPARPLMPDMDPTTEVICTSTNVHQESFEAVMRRPEPAALVVPRFQRRYCWERAQWAKLLSDLEAAVATGNGLFLGRVLAFAGPDEPGPLVCDGQQRLVTVCLALAALRDVAEACSARGLADELDGLLFLDGTGRSKPRLVPTYYDQAPYAAALAGERPPSAPAAGAPAGEGAPAAAEDLIGAAKAFFARHLRTAFARQHPSPDPAPAAAVPWSPPAPRADWLPTVARWVRACREQVSFVYFQLREDEEVHRVFELHAHREKVLRTTWNFDVPGMQLAACDLIRNLVLGAVPGPARQREAYDELWAPMESHATGGSGKPFDLEAFFMAFLHAVSFSVGARPELYAGFKAWLQGAVLREVPEGDEGARAAAVRKGLERMLAEAKKWEEHVHKHKPAAEEGA
eukprot:CAMPEP_0206017786 /NCGR_PEP_ID=MMETSP1464-20131121/25748_1 /ASSEMBLY_ACC=CAM_ASM_001124 /TAXON_ID=119497 /ORGANISM="Exanthemachrysis gayraliae, Strain RCC1523" /LENGTH=405 /DNA_ID=CAMNT_0053391637 /DNA_START=27 /DNA_END=1244 /DNA_ORIENTATION=-